MTASNSAFDRYALPGGHDRDILAVLDEVITVLDAEGRIVYTNRPIPGQSVGDRIADPESPTTNNVIDERGDPIEWSERAGVRCLATGATITQVQGFNISGLGETFWTRTTATPIHIDGARGAVLSIIDISSLIRAQAELRQSAERMDESQAIAHLGSWVWNRVDETLTWSKEMIAICGRNTVDLVSFQLPFHPDDAAGANTHFGGMVEGESRDLIHRILRPDGEIRWVDSRTRVERNLSGHLVMLGTCLDITDRIESEHRQRSIEESLARTARLDAIGQLAGGMAHDLNNALGVILLSAESLAGQSSDPSVIRGVNRIISTTSRATSMTHKLLTFSHHAPVEMGTVVLPQLLEDVAELFATGLDSQLNLRNTCPNDLWSVNGDPGLIEQLTINLLINARDASGPGCTITLEATNATLATGDHHVLAAGRYVRLEVSDDGNGMTPDVTSRAFEPFFTTKLAGEGTGLGLAQVYGSVIQMGGDIEIHSKPGIGTVVRMLLPAVPGSITSETPTAASSTASSSTSSTGTSGAQRQGDAVPADPAASGNHDTGLRLLVVDDEPGLADAIAGILEAHSDIRVVASAINAVEAAGQASTQPDVALVDVGLPGGGPAAVRAILRASPRTRVLAYSGQQESSAVLSMLEAGAAGYLLKGSSGHELIEGLLRAAAGESVLTGSVTQHVVLDLVDRLRADTDRAQASADHRAEIDALIAELTMEWQPIVDATDRAVGFEALARFNHSGTSPDIAFSLAAAHGRAHDLELAAFSAACAEADALPTGTYAAINASPSLLLSSRLRAALPVGTKPIVIEITEHEEIADHGAMATAVNELRALGFKVAVDDAGTGHAGLVGLMRLRPDIIKIDRSLIEQIETSVVEQAVVEGLLVLAFRLGATVVAEGVERAEQLDALRHLGVPLVQGFVIARPMPLPVVLQRWGAAEAPSTTNERETQP